MIKITDKTQCCGCSSCAQRCPKQSITMVQDEEGFLYPQVDATTCIECGLCEKVCPVQTSKPSHNPQKLFAAKNPDEIIRKESSSGGVFTMIAESVIREGGVVFGARWSKDWNVEHSYIDPLNYLNASEALNHLNLFRGSKYVQSNINDCYQNAEAFLQDGRKVLFSGTPCQIAGLKTYLRKEYENLLTVECACHGVPSPGLWQKYLAEVSKGKEVTYINHRDKRAGWRNYSVVIRFLDATEIAQPHDDNPWTRAFIKNFSLRPSCHHCTFKLVQSSADITLGDLWGAGILVPKYNDDKGITLVISHTKVGGDALKDVVTIKEIPVQEAIRYNGALLSSPKPNENRSCLFKNTTSGNSFIKTVKTLTRAPLILRLKIMISKLLKY